ncbi:YdiK family protein [Bacillus sp. REN16]|uniref:YdiK family protein n=1 Tax=Bacillus sp. REN16 TaxID=2887296 RepID=UPI001E5543B0|nr:YdiK family protein [Bacillus sp. REN16]MCC3359614.1 YdiK family protein [Bacillus sp. REN16]
MRRTSPFAMGIIYALMGTLFTYIAINSASESIWNFSTILLALVATFDFGVAIRMFVLHTKIKKVTNAKK